MADVASSSQAKTSLKLFAKNGWTLTGVYLKKGDQITIQSEGLWSGGQIEYQQNDLRLSALRFCGAEGCNGDIPIRTSVVDLPGIDDDRIDLESIDVEIADKPALSESKCGYRNGLFDGKRVCYASDNTFLGDDEPEVGDFFRDGGFWSTQRLHWNSVRTQLLEAQSQSDINSAAFDQHLAAVEEILNIYKRATCSNPPQIGRLRTALLDLADLNPNYISLHQTFYEVSYIVDVPPNNYKACCHNSNQPTIQSFRFGLPSSVVEKNECVYEETANHGQLVMKIVGEDELLKDIPPSIVGKKFETQAYTADRTGWLYLSHNDLSHGRFDNQGYLEINIERQDSER